VTEDVLEERIEAALKVGLALSTALLLLGLSAGRTGPLRAGLVLLMATPVVRVIVVTAFMLVRRDWLFGLISLFVLGVLLSGVVVALGLR
jgi:uncharacterized membrane protein